MMLTDQLDFNNPDHVTVCCKHDRLTIYISNNNSSVRLTYALQTEDSCSPPPPPLQPSELDSHGSNAPEYPH
jgi:hypothetical protein